MASVMNTTKSGILIAKKNTIKTKIKKFEMNDVNMKSDEEESKSSKSSGNDIEDEHLSVHMLNIVRLS